MGIPKFFKWLTRRYPLILKNIQREEDCPPIDNLYLDLNGIVHNCIHGNDSKKHERISKLTDFDEVWASIMKAIDELVHTIKPKKMLFMAVDGVAPRAKMNQQRARRFRSAKDSQMLKEQLTKEGKEAPDLFDSNAISPGTKFMHELNRQLEFFVNYKANTDPLYQHLESIILSDASVPGEGEHKMMDYIRQAKNKPNYDPNTRHCFYGADADLIMLSLITHEPNFMIIREEHVVKKIKQGGVQRLDLQRTSNFQLIFITLMREYLQLEFSVIGPQMKMRFDLERIIDDFVFFCFFIGNDFLPSLSALDISEGSLDSLIDLYKKLLPQMSNYITEAGLIYWDRAEPFINMLGKHEHESFKKRIHSIEQAKYERIISFDPDFGKAETKIDKATIIKNKIRAKLQEKKKTKILHLTSKNKAKQFKKFLLMKRFEEDDVSKSLTDQQKEIREQLITKYKKLRDQQQQVQQTQSEGEKTEDKKQMETLRDIISGIKEEYFSDLQVDDIGDEEVSDVDESEIDITDIPDVDTNQELENKIKVQQQIIDKYSEENLEFMHEFIKIYARDPDEAKQKYYMKKVKFDVHTPEGQGAKKKMLMKYIEGLQWVLYYYYRGAQHWRWYYPYHYAPMISDINEGIVQNFLSGRVTIEKFEVDANCSDTNQPYTPFQQLLSILPAKSIGLMPEQYQKIVYEELREYFPDDFDIDLNGRALPWEAACLIPFIKEELFIACEQKLLEKVPLQEQDVLRNRIHFHYKSLKYDEELKRNGEGKKRDLFSTLTKLESLKYNYVSCQLITEYKDVGSYSFLPKLHPDVRWPSPDFPSFTWIGINSIDYDEKVINQVAFKRVLVKIPTCPEDSSSENLESSINRFVKQAQKELYIGFPYQIEAFPIVFEDDKYTFTLYGDVYTNIYKIQKDVQQLDKDKFEHFQRRQRWKMQDQGLLVDETCKAFATFNRVQDVRYDSTHNQYYKVYCEQEDIVPLSMVMKRRDPQHYLNVNFRCNSAIQAYQVRQQVVCLNMQLFGVVGCVQQIDAKKNVIKVEFDKEEEEAKIHDPFFGQMCLLNQSLNSNNKKDRKRYYTDSMVEQELRLRNNIINKLTSSFLITFNDKQKMERQVIDLGLNVKNYTKKVHIADYVRFVADEDLLAQNQHDDYQHNYHARGAKHVRRHWEYSEECFQIIKEYHQKYKEVFDCVFKTMKSNKQVISLKELYPQLDPEVAAERVRSIASWIESLPISHLPYVEMGFDALHEDLILKLNNHKNTIKSHYQTIKLKCRQYEYLQALMLYQEHYPYWSQPFSSKEVSDFRVGDRVMNINSTKREYIPFGIRGTVVGKTNEKVIVLFDDQFLNGNNIYGHCEDYKGGYINPNFLLNLTKKFASIVKKNAQLAQSFQEKPYSADDQQQTTEYEKTQEEQTQPKMGARKISHKLDKKQYQEKQQQQEEEESKVAGIASGGVEYIDTSSSAQHRQVYYVPKGTQHSQGEQNYTAEGVTDYQPEIIQKTSHEPAVFDYTQQEEFKSIQGVHPQNEEDIRLDDDYGGNDNDDQPSGLIPNQNLYNNPDFQQLMDMMNLAKMLQAPLNLFQPSNFDVNATEFKPTATSSSQVPPTDGSTEPAISGQPNQLEESKEEQIQEAVQEQKQEQQQNNQEQQQ